MKRTQHTALVLDNNTGRIHRQYSHVITYLPQAVFKRDNENVVHACAHTHTHTHAHMRTHPHICMHTHIYIYTDAHMHTPAHAHTHTHARTFRKTDKHEAHPN
jgi:hypothetical protein